MSDEKPPRKFWIRPEGISKSCVNHAAVYTEQDLLLAENREFVLEGVYVIEHWAYSELQDKLSDQTQRMLNLRGDWLEAMDRAEKAEFKLSRFDDSIAGMVSGFEGVRIKLEDKLTKAESSAQDFSQLCAIKEAKCQELEAKIKELEQSLEDARYEAMGEDL